MDQERTLPFHNKNSQLSQLSLILDNLQYSTKVLKFWILSKYQSLVWLAFLFLKEKWYVF